MPGARVGFLVLDRNGNGVVDSLGELFGQAVSGSRHPEGPATSLADLALFDRPEQGGSGDGVISAADAVFAQLRIWVDLNHDGVSQPGELLTLAQAGIASIDLTAQPVGRRDRYGNYFRARAVVHLTDGHQTTVWDVFLAARLNGESASAPSLAGAGGTGPNSAGFAGLGTGLIALGFATLIRARRRRREEPATRLAPVMVKIGATAATTIAVVVLLPSATFGQTWQVVEYCDSDALGSIRAVTNQQGQVLARHDYLPFGEELNPQTPPHDKRLFTGQERDFETGQDFFNARQLRTDLGRFLMPDPVALAPQVVGSQGLNSYAYVVNNPLGLVDPTGLNQDWVNAPMIDNQSGPTALPDGAVFDQMGKTNFLIGQDIKLWVMTYEQGPTPQVTTSISGVQVAQTPAAVVKVGEVDHQKKPGAYRGNRFKGMVYLYQVVDAAGNPVIGQLVVSEILVALPLEGPPPMAASALAPDGMFRDYVGYPQGRDWPQNRQSANLQLFVVNYAGTDYVLSTVVLQERSANGIGDVTARSTIIFP